MTSIQTFRILVILAIVSVFAAGCAVPHAGMKQDVAASYIVQGESLAAVKQLVEEEGGEITHELGVIRAVAAMLTTAEVEALRGHAAIRAIHENGSVETASKGSKNSNGGGGNYTTINTYFPQLVNADDLHAMGITGAGVGIAVLDTGLWKHNGLTKDHTGADRIVAVYNAIADKVQSTASGEIRTTPAAVATQMDPSAASVRS